MNKDAINNNLPKMIDHTLLKPDAQREDIIKLSKEALKYNFASVCVNPTWVKTAHDVLKGTEVKVCTVIGFPLGATNSEVKAFEAERAILDGAKEIDMVINIGSLKDKEDTLVLEDIKSVVKKAQGQVIVKVIIETALLTEEERIRACRLAVKAGADFVKTSTGFSGGGATAEDIQLMRKAVGPEIGVKASGGIKNYEDAFRMIKAGANRIGASKGIEIIKEVLKN
ncbi:deoxyribose-phosphate aldolase [Desulfonispora thiosulfatigenes]|nr:deoxyribose-phosphate aldolase [Desulfonispora thiosulfatigenes]